MPLLLCIDTATEYAGTCISKDGIVIAKRENKDPKNHGAFLQPAIQSLCIETNIALADIDAVAVTAGPGSYTGLRVGMASAKGICYTLQKPLITVNTLSIIAHAANKDISLQETNYLIYPMIDARRMEVFMSVYTPDLAELQAPQALVLSSDYLATLNPSTSILFCGNGAAKIPIIPTDLTYIIHTALHSIEDMLLLSEQAFQKNHFADLAYTEPMYAKAFHDTRKKTTT
ncbi:MAG: tRNA (adenosine(37)-N6)-threonylcarbamoyltransferase complex dimerization subunit type 1 TsaB [Chitinophagaceae bacterium]|nr:tRNA (adenosine(37)-N6)-threonylcarbamoyltransferase complex dimerization subunit type 1 TsaB [Chitinophagaceae bacterium]